MFVGEAPGADEDKQGLPFVGRSGQLLDRMLAAIGLDRSQRLYRQHRALAAARQPHADAAGVAICLPFIQRQIELRNPDVLVASAARRRALLGVQGITKNRGRWFPYQHRHARNPRHGDVASGLSAAQPMQKRLAWRDLLAIKKALG